jgi:hypothetical protein
MKGLDHHGDVIAGLDPAIHQKINLIEARWMRGSSPRMTSMLSA